MQESELVVVGTFPNRIAAEMASGALTAHGIDSRVSADDVGGAYAGMLPGGVSLIVRAEDAEQAIEVLSQTSQ